MSSRFKLCVQSYTNKYKYFFQACFPKDSQFDKTVTFFSYFVQVQLESLTQLLMNIQFSEHTAFLERMKVDSS
jgi:hypothetical protein